METITSYSQFRRGLLTDERIEFSGKLDLNGCPILMKFKMKMTNGESHIILLYANTIKEVAEYIVDGVKTWLVDDNDNIVFLHNIVSISSVK